MSSKQKDAAHRDVPANKSERLLTMIRRSWRSFLTILLSGCAGLEVLNAAIRQGPLNSKWEYLGVLIGIGAVGLAAILQFWRGIFSSIIDGGDRSIETEAGNWRNLRFLAIAFIVVAFSVLVMSPSGYFLDFLLVRFLLLWLLSVLGTLIWERGRIKSASWRPQLLTALVLGSFYQIATYLPLVSTFPLTLGWSETSRYYYASLFVAEQIYGFKTALSVLHPSRYLLQAVPFFLTSKLLWVHRLWQVFLWLGLSMATGWSLQRRLGRKSAWLSLGITLWGFLFLFQGPIIYHLLVPVVIVYLGFNARYPFRSLLIVLLASLWAGISRINWIPVPAFLAVTLLFLEQRVKQNIWDYLRWPLLWGFFGSLAALLSQYSYITLSGNALTQFGSSFSSDLLWFRLFPNPTFPPGILLATFLASAPIWFVIWATRDRWLSVHPIRWMGIGALLTVLLGGGLIVSLKIGGGSNLHNLDAYLILLMTVGAYLALGNIGIDGIKSAGELRVSRPVLLFAIAVPLLFVVSTGGVYQPLDFMEGSKAVGAIEDQISRLPENPQVLFLGERHLLTFDYIQGVELIPEYERVFLMEMAMSNTEPYLDQFQRRLSEKEFDLIISDALKVQFQGRGRAFGVENDSWVRHVSIPVLCHYQPVETFPELDVQILEPKPNSPDCPVPGQ